MRLMVDGQKFGQAMQRLETVYWHLHRNGGPDLEVQAIQRLLADAALADTDPDDDELVLIEEKPPQPAA
jgi:hypothetical protein